MKTQFLKGIAACFIICLLGFSLNASDVWITVSAHVTDGDTGEGIMGCELSSDSFQSGQEDVTTDISGYTTSAVTIRKGGSITYSADGFVSSSRNYSISVVNDEVSLFTK